MTIRLTNGRVGRLSFDQVNRMMDAADASMSRVIERGSRPEIQARQPFAAQLISQTTILVETGDEGGMTYPLWSWAEAIVSSDGKTNRVGQSGSAFRSDGFGGGIAGLAMQLGGRAQPNDIVLMTRVLTSQGVSMYAFTGATVQAYSSLLKITSSQQYVSTPNKQWRYNVQPVHWPEIPRMDLPAGHAYNLYEKSLYRNQPMSMQNPNATLSVTGPITGLVHGTLVSRSSDTQAVWAFEAVNAMTLQCGSGLTDL